MYIKEIFFVASFECLPRVLLCANFYWALFCEISLVVSSLITIFTLVSTLYGLECCFVNCSNYFTINKKMCLHISDSSHNVWWNGRGTISKKFCNYFFFPKNFLSYHLHWKGDSIEQWTKIRIMRLEKIF